MPSPRSGEQQSKFISRCVSSKESKKSFPDQKQRVAFCHSQWTNKSKSHILNRTEEIYGEEKSGASKYKCPYDNFNTVWTGKTKTIFSKIFYVMRCTAGHETLSESPN